MTVSDRVAAGVATDPEPTPEDIDRRLRIDLAFVRDLIGGGNLGDDHLREVLAWLAGWSYPYSVDRWVKLTPSQHAAVKATAAEAIRARGGEFPDGLWVWVITGDGEVRATAAETAAG